ncbi:MAG TPA: V-type ATP synthase subunit D [Bacteroidales bacterium]|nr:V-type ATP synthase subunit D [Bacteroidales bacterium]HPR57935.1 V-type ATP synthase subunit D [Bacteroidales bacterium]HRW97347.1 V-type ATP synthase subunit D [Bacteroidales bacterium]
MAIKFHYNKTSLQQLSKQLKIRVNALPTLKNKESALRTEVKKAKDEAARLDRLLDEKIIANNSTLRLWNEFKPELVAIKEVKLSVKKIAGVKTPILDDIVFEIKEYSLFKNPSWYPDGINVIRELARIALERDVFERKTELLDFARKKTTQKVNLYEKVQIPGYEEAILKIKRFMEDEENLSKSSQKIVKSRMEKKESEAA